MEHAAPNTYAAAEDGPINQYSVAATTSTNGTSTEYSRLRNAIAPDWMALASSTMTSSPAGWRLT
jgi:hypothetical protein